MPADVKSDRGYIGTIFLRFPDIESAWTAYKSNVTTPIITNDSPTFLSRSRGSSTDLHIYNMPIDFSQEEMTAELSKFGTLTSVIACEFLLLLIVAFRLTMYDQPLEKTAPRFLDGQT